MNAYGNALLKEKKMFAGRFAFIFIAIMVIVRVHATVKVLKVSKQILFLTQ